MSFCVPIYGGGRYHLVQALCTSSSAVSAGVATTAPRRSAQRTAVTPAVERSCEQVSKDSLRRAHVRLIRRASLAMRQGRLDAGRQTRPVRVVPRTGANSDRLSESHSVRRGTSPLTACDRAGVGTPWGHPARARTRAYAPSRGEGARKVRSAVESTSGKQPSPPVVLIIRRSAVRIHPGPLEKPQQ